MVTTTATGWRNGSTSRWQRRRPPHPVPSAATRRRRTLFSAPRCGTELMTACPECHRAVKADWVRCAYCGEPLV
ncbi:MAG: zinc ribbon domain-containing protein [Anaerolineae bacterium]